MGDSEKTRSVYLKGSHVSPGQLRLRKWQEETQKERLGPKTQAPDPQLNAERRRAAMGGSMMKQFE